MRVSKVLVWMALLTCVSAPIFGADFQDSSSRVNLKYAGEWEPGDVSGSAQILSLHHKDQVTSLNIYVVNYVETPTANGIQKFRAASLFEGWRNVGERFGSDVETKRANSDDSYVAVYSKNELREGLQTTEWIVAEYYFVKGNRGYIVSLGTRKDLWRDVQGSFKDLLQSFWLGGTGKATIAAQPIVTAPAGDVDWTMVGGNAANQRAVADRFRLKGNESVPAWEYAETMDGGAIASGGPLLVGDKVVFTTGYEVLALDLSGKVVWRQHTGSLVSNHLAYGAGVVVAVSDARPAQLIGFSLKDGHVLYRTELSEGATSQPLVFRDKVILQKGGLLAAYTVDTGRESWKRSFSGTPDQYWIASANRLIGIESGKVLVALNADTGNELWRKAVPGRLTGVPAIYNDLVLLFHQAAKKDGSEVPVIQALQLEDGSARWRFVGSTVFSQWTAAPCLIDGTAYILFQKNESAQLMVAVDLAKGKTLWKYQWEAYAANPMLNPVVSSSTVYLLKGSYEQEEGVVLLALNRRTGKELSKLRLDTALKDPTLRVKFLRPYGDYLIVESEYTGFKFTAIK